MQFPIMNVKEVTSETELLDMLSQRLEHFPGGGYDLLYEYAKEMGGDIVELGAYHGKSTCVLAAACAFWQKGKVFSLER